MKKSIVRTVDPNPLLSVGEASRRTGLSAYFVRKLCEQKAIIAYMILNTWKIDPVSLDRYMNQQMNV